MMVKALSGKLFCTGTGLVYRMFENITSCKLLTLLVLNNRSLNFKKYMLHVKTCCCFVVLHVKTCCYFVVLHVRTQ